MNEPLQYRFGNCPILCHAWNKDRSQIAFSPNNHEVHIWERVGSEWKPIDTLNQHDLLVKGIDWAPETNRIVTSAADRNAYVWTQDPTEKKWKPTLVLLRINRAATCVHWSPKENKFAVGSGARIISVCYFESENDWWVSKHIKKPIRSTITDVNWHPNNVLLVAGSTDFKVRIYSAFIKDIEKNPDGSAWAQTAGPLGQLLWEFSNSEFGGGWIYSVSFSPDGNQLCWVSRDSSINLVQPHKQPQKVVTPFLPYTRVIWVSNRAVVAAGHSCVPVLYCIDENSGQMEFAAKLDTSQKKEAAGLSAMKLFRSLDKLAAYEAQETTLDSIHQNAITSLRPFEGTKTNVTKFSTSGLDGQLTIWELKHLTATFKALTIS